MNKATRSSCTFPIHNFLQVKDQMLNWAKQFNVFCFLDNHQYHIEPHTMECMLAADLLDYIQADAEDALIQLQKFIDHKKDWLFGHLSYDLKNGIEKLHSSHNDQIRFPDLLFFQARTVIRLYEKEMIIESEKPESIYHAIRLEHSYFVSQADNEKAAHILIQNRIPKEEYLDIIQQLQKHILRGDCYEINFCQEFFAENIFIDPLAVYKKLSAVSPNPFSAIYKIEDKFLICASPERFLKKQKTKILSQPIKGTSKRVLTNTEEDTINRNKLKNSPKDQSENVIVVDLVRNDLSKVCEEGSVMVDELYGIYSFPQVHQMISTVSGQLKSQVSFTDIIKATFPMGSMTGAPKKRVMELIELYEKTKRGIFSGAVGYIAPDGDFDLNVVIRSIMYNSTIRYLSFQTGSGITFYSNAEEEWEECMLKAEAIKKVLTS